MHQGVETPPVNHVSNPAMPEWHYHGYIDLYELSLFFNFLPRSALGWPALPSNWFSVMFKFVYPDRYPLEVDRVLVLVEGALEGASMGQHWSFVLKGGVIQLVAQRMFII